MSHRFRKEESVRRPEIDLALVRANAANAIFPPPITPNILTQTGIFIDPVAGNDSATGLSPATAMKTWREYWRRMSVAAAPFLAVTLTGVSQTVTMLSSQPDDTDPIYPDLVLSTSAQWALVGSFIPTHAGTFTAVTTKNRATNTNPTVTDGTTFVVGDAGRFILDTTTGAGAWVDKVSANVARMTSFVDPIATFAGFFVHPAFNDTAAPGNAYQIGQFTRILLAGAKVTNASVDSNVGFGRNNAYFANLYCSLPVAGIGGEGLVVTGDSQGAQIIFNQCRVDATITFVNGCRGNNSYFALGLISAGGGGSFAAVNNGTVQLGALLAGAQVLQIDGDCVFSNADSASGQSGGQLWLGLVCFNDTAGVGGSFFPVEATGTVIFRNIAYGSRKLWGTSSLAGAFVTLGAGARMFCQSPGTVATDIGIASAGATINGTTTALPFNIATGLYGAATPTTFANFAGAFGAGFAGTMSDPTKNGAGVFSQ